MPRNGKEGILFSFHHVRNHDLCDGGTQLRRTHR